MSWKIEVADLSPHTLTVLSVGKGDIGAKQSVALSSGDAKAVRLFDGGQGGTIVQFRFIGPVTLTLKQTFGGMGASDPGANCAALFFD